MTKYHLYLFTLLMLVLAVVGIVYTFDNPFSSAGNPGASGRW